MHRIATGVAGAHAVGGTLRQGVCTVHGCQGVVEGLFEQSSTQQVRQRTGPGGGQGGR